MLHKCMKCGKVYDNQSPALFVGCECGTRLFVLMQDAKFESQMPQKEELEKINKQLNNNPEFQKATRKLLEPTHASIRPLVVEIKKASNLDDVENIKVYERGRYELDIDSLMRGNPIVIKTDKEVYYVQIPIPKIATS